MDTEKSKQIMYGYEACIDGKWQKITAHELLFYWVGSLRLTAYRWIENREVVKVVKYRDFVAADQDGTRR